MRAHLASLVDDFRRNGDELAVVMHRGVRRHVTTYQQLADLAGRFSAELLRRGIAPGERVVLWAENSAEWIGVFFGCVLRGVLVVPLDAAGAPTFAQNVIQEVNPRLIITDAERAKALATELPILELAGMNRALPSEPDFTIDPTVTEGTPFQIVFTSGTTSEPKGIVHTHRNILANLQPIEKEIRKYLRYERLIHPLRFLHTLPFSHVFGQFMGLWIPSILSAEVHLVDGIEAQRMVPLIQRERISVLIAVPRILGLLQTYLLAAGLVRSSDVEATASLSAWRRWWRFRAVHRTFGWKFWAIISGGAALPADLELFWNRLGFALIQGYGMTETAALVTLNHPFRISRGSIGKPLSGDAVKVSDSGELLVRGDMVSTATWQQGKLQKHAVDWFATGDLAQQSSTGEFHFLGRKGETIVTSSGLNIFPVDLETAMMNQSGVRACAVVPCNFATGPEPVCIVIFDGDDAALQAAVRHANSEIAPYQQIRRILRWPQVSFPYTSTGKVLKRQIMDWACRILAGELSSTKAPSDPLFALISSLTGESIPNGRDDLRLSEDLHLDSLGRMQLASMIEQTTGTLVSDTEIAKAGTVGDLRHILGAPSAASPASAAPATSPPPPLTRAAAIETSSAVCQPLKYQYPRWPWSYPLHLVRTLFTEAVVRPLVGIFLAPRVIASVRLLPGPLLLVANHITVLDAPLILYALPFHLRRGVAIAMSGELLLDFHSGRRPRVPGRLLGPCAYWLMTALFNVFPLPRLQGFRESFAHAGDALDHNYSVLVFPEGTRSTTGQIAPFRPGIGLLAKQAEVSVLPVALIGMEKISSRRTRWFRSGALEVRVGEPVLWHPGKSASDWTAELESAVRQLHD
ncbi:AMP-binding protein [Edaphobacter sp. 12200R-103]|uniref:AMP-binding protein n=1 Tax=Edaphobacter sp. 12200R-103 TaxID=2703788 RepID=UPI00138C43F7|nr:AMP-binding protein [Edaphobacter sp. 12200R-103]QHS51080.1 AMP-binding protein [Edaphobacter sp. 12200R-103]